MVCVSKSGCLSDRRTAITCVHVYRILSHVKPVPDIAAHLWCGNGCVQSRVVQLSKRHSLIENNIVKSCEEEGHFEFYTCHKLLWKCIKEGNNYITHDCVSIKREVSRSLLKVCQRSGKLIHCIPT